jgi:chaperone BCS1
MLYRNLLWIVRLFSSNEYLMSMLLYSGAEALREWMSQAWAQASNAISNALFTHIRLGAEQKRELMAYLQKQPRVTSGSSMLSMHTSNSGGSGAKRTFVYEPELNESLRFTHADRYVWTANYTYAASPENPEQEISTTLSVFGRSRETIEDLLEEGRRILRERRKTHLHIIHTWNYTEDNYGLGWNPGTEASLKKQPPGRSISSVVLPRAKSGAGRDQAEALLEDARDFFASAAWYRERGVPHRRGYLLSGLPGTGKSSLVQAIASELSLPIYLLSLSSDLLDDLTLARLMQSMDITPSIVLIEDVDAMSDIVHGSGATSSTPTSDEGGGVEGAGSGAAGATGEQKQAALHERKKRSRRKRNPRLTLSGVLNALDGPSATTERLLFLTTNNRSALHPALIRSGRIDVEIEFGAVTSDQAERLFARFYSDFDFESGQPIGEVPAAIAEMARTFARVVSTAEGKQPLTAADVSGFLLKHKASARSALDSAGALAAGNSFSCQ